MQELHEQHENFHFYPVLSRETPETWHGPTGYVHTIYEDIFADRRPATFYICGWKAMLVEARKRIEAMGYDRKRIKFESYD
jgi:CDP-4-dehydro-6-deoxyglucose reductase